MRKLTYVVLAAGSSVRMGFAKATTPLAGVSPLERLGATLAGRETAIVTSAELRDECARLMPDATVLVNQNPAAGMSSSLLVAHRALDPEATLGVLLADKPFLENGTLVRCERALDESTCDVLYATIAGERGHPVYFGPKARARMAALPAGDTLRALRDDPELIALAVECGDPGIAIDLDTPGAWRAAEGRLHA